MHACTYIICTAVQVNVLFITDSKPEEERQKERENLRGGGMKGKKPSHSTHTGCPLTYWQFAQGLDVLHMCTLFHFKDNHHYRSKKTSRYRASSHFMMLYITMPTQQHKNQVRQFGVIRNKLFISGTILTTAGKILYELKLHSFAFTLSSKSQAHNRTEPG